MNKTNESKNKQLTQFNRTAILRTVVADAES
ncbi:unnamed protein product, partial [marine sediment metagenome]